MLPKIVKETAVTMALHIRKKNGVYPNWPNIATKFAKRGTDRSLLLLNWASWHPAASATHWTEFDGNTPSSTSPGESCARLPAGLWPHRHLWSHRQSTWNAQKRTVGIKGWQSVAAPLASDLCNSDHLQLCISIFWRSMLPNVVKETAVPMALNIRKKKRTQRLTNWPNIATKFARRGTQKICFSQIGPAGTAQLLPRSGRNSRATTKVQLLQGRVAQDFQQVCGPIGTCAAKVKAPGRRGYTAPAGRWHNEKGTFTPCKPQSSKNLAFVGGPFPYYHLDGAKCKIYHKPQKILA